MTVAWISTRRLTILTGDTMWANRRGMVIKLLNLLHEWFLPRYEKLSWKLPLKEEFLAQTSPGPEFSIYCMCHAYFTKRSPSHWRKPAQHVAECWLFQRKSLPALCGLKDELTIYRKPWGLSWRPNQYHDCFWRFFVLLQLRKMASPLLRILTLMKENQGKYGVCKLWIHDYGGMEGFIKYKNHKTFWRMEEAW